MTSVSRKCRTLTHWVARYAAHLRGSCRESEACILKRVQQMAARDSRFRYLNDLLSRYVKAARHSYELRYGPLPPSVDLDDRMVARVWRRILDETHGGDTCRITPGESRPVRSLLRRVTKEVVVEQVRESVAVASKFPDFSARVRCYVASARRNYEKRYRPLPSVIDLDDMVNRVVELVEEWMWDPTKCPIAPGVKTSVMALVRRATARVIAWARRYKSGHGRILGETQSCTYDETWRERFFLREAIETALGRLPERTRRVYELKCHDNMTHEEIAKEVGIGKNTVTTILDELKQALADLLCKGG